MLTALLGLALSAGSVEDVTRLENTLAVLRWSGANVASMGKRLLDENELAIAFGPVPAARELAERAREQRSLTTPLGVTAGFFLGGGLAMALFLSPWVGIAIAVVGLALAITGLVLEAQGQGNRQRAVWAWNHAQLRAPGLDEDLALRIAAEWIGPCEDGASACMGPKRLDDPRPALASVPDAKALFDQGASHATTGLVLLFSSVGLDGAGVVLFAVGAALLSVPLLVAAGAVMLTSVLLILAGNGLLQAARREVFDSLALFDRALLEKARREVLEANPEPSPAGAILMTF